MSYQGGYGGGYGGGPSGGYNGGYGGGQQGSGGAHGGGNRGGYDGRPAGHGSGFQTPLPPSYQGYNQYPPHGGPPPQHGYNQYPPPQGPPPPQAYNQYLPQGPPPPQHGYNQYPPPGPPPQPGYNQFPPQGSPTPQHGYNQYPPRGGPPPNPYPPSSYPSPQRLGPNEYSAAGAHGGPPPPTAPQQFGHGAPAGYTFQYSNCTGTRKALLIGINYIGQPAALAGCINDTKNLSAFLIERYHYKREDMIILTDDQTNPILQPTKANIIRALEWLVRGAKPNDALFLHYSGHGGQTADLDGDEEDGADEVIYPVDYKQAGHIVDDQLHHIVVKPLVAGVRLTAIFDSCHSGSVLDIPYIYSTKGVLKEPNLAAEAGQGLLRAITAYATGNRGGVASAIMGIAKTAVKGDAAYKKTIETKTSPADVIMWSGSRDDQTSADATIASQATGAMSYAFITALKRNPKQSYVELLNSIRNILESKYSQKPQLSCSHPLDTNLLFVM
ncbi:caspase domain-containing protein [Xylaria nigripes]|nr:caspase domain-containing protein [Xylaria nigripes]